MPIHSEESQEQHTIVLQGDFDAVLAPEARDIFGKVAENANKKVVLDFNDVKFMDSSGVGALVFLYKRLREAKQDLILQGVRAQPAELMKLLRIDKIIETR